MALVVALVMVEASAIQASTLTHVWSQRLGGPGDESMTGTSAVDAAGNVYVAGSFAGSIDLGGGPLVSSGSFDVFLAKFDDEGIHQWSRRFGGALNDSGHGIAVDADANVYITGAFSGLADFGGGELVSAGSRDVFFAKYDDAGTHVWSRRFGDDVGPDYGEAVAVDTSGNVFLAGRFQGTVDLGGGNLDSAGLWDLFLTKVDPQGNHLWSRRFGSTDHDYLLDAASDGTDVFITGHIYESVDLGGGVLPVTAGENIYLARYDGATGEHVWSEGLGGSGAQHAGAVAVGGGTVALTGDYTGTTDLGGGPLPSPPGYHMYVALYDAATGGHLWSHGFASAGTDAGADVALDGAGSVVVGASMGGDIDFGGGTLSAIGDGDVCLAKFDATGNHDWSARWGGIESDEAASVVVDPAGNVIFSAMFQLAVDFGGGPLSSLGGLDLALVKYTGSVTTDAPAMAVHELSIARHPNPFNPSTTVEFTVPSPGHVAVTIHDVRGRHVTTLVEGWRDAGSYSARWNGRGDAGTPAASGVYVARIEHGSFLQSTKLVLSK